MATPKPIPFYQPVVSFMAEFNDTTVMGLPSDVVSHVVLGFVIYWYVAEFSRRSTGLLAAFALAMVKEMTIDLYSIYYSTGFGEAVKDVAATVFLPLVLAFLDLPATKNERAEKSNFKKEL